MTTMTELRTTMTLEDVARACLHLKRKGEAMRAEQQRADGRALLRKQGGG